MSDILNQYMYEDFTKQLIKYKQKYIVSEKTTIQYFNTNTLFTAKNIA